MDLMDSDYIAGYLKDKISLLDENTKLSIIKQLILKDFTKAQN